MADTELDWTFEAIPIEGEDEAQRLKPAAPARVPPAARGRRHGWLLAVAGALGVLALAGGSLYLIYVRGWQRVERQLAHEVAYEDTQARARNAEAVAALQWPSSQAWTQTRLSETALGWPARPPADDLLPAGEHARVLAVDSLAVDHAAVTVLRTFADSAGRLYDFEYVQHYRSVGPGLWQRLAPPDLEATTTWAGRRLSVTLPTADLPWLKPLLPQIDAYLVRACAEWQCPTDLVAPLAFTGRLEDLPRLSPPRRGEPPAEGLAYPAAFDLTFRTPRYPRRLILPSLHLAGRPHDAAAQAALVRSTTVSLLADIAAELSQTARSSRGDYLDALVARAEVRLGLAPTPAWTPTPGSYLPPESLWPYGIIGEATARRPGLAGRLQALAFLNWALAGHLPSADAALLRELRFENRLDEWLTRALNVDGAALVARWDSETTASFAERWPPRWDTLDGLAYVCADGAWLVRGGQPVPLPLRGPHQRLTRDALSPSGQHLVVVETSASPVSRIRVLDLENGGSTVVAAEGLGLPLGWSAGGQLLYLTQVNGPFSPMFSYELRLYHPGTGQTLALSGEPLVTPWGHEQSWSSDRAQVAVTLVQAAGPARGQIAVAPAVIDLSQPLQVRRVPVQGYAAALAPDGQRLAYFSGYFAAGEIASGPQPPAGLDLVDLETRFAYSLLAPGRPGQPDFHELHSLVWSPDATRLAFVDYASGAGSRLYALSLNPADPGAGAELDLLVGPLLQLSLAGFSADSRYLAALHYDQLRSEMIVYDLQTGRAQRQLSSESANPWSPRGRLLALASPGGVYVVEAASGEAQWVRRGACEVAWLGGP